jgi:hypothetical protein
LADGTGRHGGVDAGLKETNSELREHGPVFAEQGNYVIYLTVAHIKARDGRRPKLLSRQARHHKSNPQGGLTTTEGELGSEGVKSGSFRTKDDYSPTLLRN